MFLIWHNGIHVSKEMNIGVRSAGYRVHSCSHVSHFILSEIHIQKGDFVLAELYL